MCFDISPIPENHRRILPARAFLKKHLLISTIIKYAFSVTLGAAAAFHDGSKLLFMSIIELLLVFAITGILMERTGIGQTVNNILMLLINIQLAVQILGGSFVTIVMLSNVDSIKDLSGRALEYILSALLIAIFSFLPVINDGFIMIVQICAIIAFSLVEVFALFNGGLDFSPIAAYFDLISQYSESAAQKSRVAAITAKYSADLSAPKGTADTVKTENAAAFSASSDTTSNVSGSASSSAASLRHISFDDGTFYKNSIDNFITKDTSLPENPNVIVIFTEGLSENIVDDSRGIMPNIASYEKKSINFTRYYNHTFATYRGISGQLFSGHQLENYDSSSLISLADIFSEAGYHTTMINTEPNNGDFTEYLEGLHFDEVADGGSGFEYKGMAGSMSDRQAYEYLLNYAENENARGTPFFTCIYTFGTHLSLDSTDEKFGNGNNAVLNRFYNLDYYFGKFMEEFESSSLFDNTIIFFTADHCAYAEQTFKNAFPNYDRNYTDVSIIPFFIYYKGVTPRNVQVNGRNSLDFAPTVCDFLDISAPNYFLGTSLFSGSGMENKLDTIFWDPGLNVSTENSSPRGLTVEEANTLNDTLDEYFALKALDPADYSGSAASETLS